MFKQNVLLGPATKIPSCSFMLPNHNGDNKTKKFKIVSRNSVLAMLRSLMNVVERCLMFKRALRLITFGRAPYSYEYGSRRTPRGASGHRARFTFVRAPYSEYGSRWTPHGASGNRAGFISAEHRTSSTAATERPAAPVLGLKLPTVLLRVLQYNP